MVLEWHAFTHITILLRNNQKITFLARIARLKIYSGIVRGRVDLVGFDFADYHEFFLLCLR